MGQGADRLAVVHEAVDVGDQRQRHHPGVAVDGLVHVGRVDGPVAVLDDAQLDALLLELLVEIERAGEVQLVDDDVALLLRQVHPHDDDVLAVGGARGEGDLGGRGVDQLAEALLQVGLAVVVEVGAARGRRPAAGRPRPPGSPWRRSGRAGAPPRRSCRSRARRRGSRRAPRRGTPRRPASRPPVRAPARAGRAANAIAPAPARNSRRPMPVIALSSPDARASGGADDGTGSAADADQDRGGAMRYWRAMSRTCACGRRPTWPRRSPPAS